MKSLDSLILSKRIRLARNIDKWKYPHLLTQDEAMDVVSEVENAFFINDELKSSFTLKRIKDGTPSGNLTAFEKRLISSSLFKEKKGAYIFKKDETVSIMINEEDHLRIQAFADRDHLWNLYDLYRETGLYDDLLEERLKFSFSPELGYLTTCPTNLGTGLRASLMVHLPRITEMDGLPIIIRKLAQMGMTIRGLYGEGSEAMGNIYQISNEVTLGVSEEFIVENIEDVVKLLLQKEMEEEGEFIEKNRILVEDRVHRSLGLLKSSRIISNEESLKLLSDVRLGAVQDILPVSLKTIDYLMVHTGTGSIIEDFDLTEENALRNIDVIRASILREALRNEEH